VGVHRFAVATAVATFGLLVAGGLVSATDSGLACPDWPLCEGKFFPPMIDGKQFEHTHRLIASFVATMTFGLMALTWKYRRGDRTLMRVGAFAVGLVIVQALLGALTVWMELPYWVSSTHLGVSMLFFATAVSMAFLTRQRMPDARFAGLEGASRVRVLRWLYLAGGLAYAQVLVGAVMRHIRGGLVCGYEILTCLGSVWPRGVQIGVHLHMIHRLVGILAGLAVLGFAFVLYRAAQARLLRWLAVSLAAGVVTQVVLGFWTVLASRDLLIMTIHTSVAAALVAGLTSAGWIIAPASAPVPLTEAEPEAEPVPSSLEPA